MSRAHHLVPLVLLAGRCLKIDGLDKRRDPIDQPNGLVPVRNTQQYLSKS